MCWDSLIYTNDEVGYSPMFGKKVDPEPGRCRRTDGKKWRCSKEAHPDSKYCERHMHRGRSRSRKPVESHSLSSSSSSFAAVLGVGSSGGLGGGGGYQNLPLRAFGSGCGSDQTQLQLDSIPYAIPSKDYNRYLEGYKPEAGERSFFSEHSGGSRGSPMYSVGNTWPFESTRLSSYSSPKPAEISMVQPDYSQHSFLNCEFGLSQSMKQGSQSLRPFFRLANSKDTWSGVGDEKVSQGSFSITDQLKNIEGSNDFSKPTHNEGF
uniref:Growth-regulating factor n=1 Tax=Opuntia streptacantha TaxID=393608 RepID=A0A7C9DEM1_OPUST